MTWLIRRGHHHHHTFCNFFQKSFVIAGVWTHNLLSCDQMLFHWATMADITFLSILLLIYMILSYSKSKRPLLVKKVTGLLSIHTSYNILIWFFSCYSRDSPPTMGNKSELHYINAVISESMRKSSVVSSGVPHFVDEDTWVGNGGGGSGHYFFPKGSNVMANLTFIHYSPGWFKTQTNHH